LNVIQWIRQKLNEFASDEIDSPWMLPVLLVAMLVYVIGGLAYLWWRM